jgi:FkbM family methyltransferase
VMTPGAPSRAQASNFARRSPDLYGRELRGRRNEHDASSRRIRRPLLSPATCALQIPLPFVARAAPTHHRSHCAYHAVRLTEPVNLWVPLNDSLWARLMFTALDFEPDVRFLLSQVLSPQSVFLDCGANIGFWTNFVAARPHAKIIAIEPSSAVFDLLAKNSRVVADDILVVKAALVEESGPQMRLSRLPGHGGNFLLDIDANWTRDKKFNDFEYVDTTTIDEVVEKHVPHADDVIVKVDIEGAEISALKGAGRLIARTHPLIIYEDHGKDTSASVSDFILNTLHLKVFTIQSNRIVSLPDLDAVKRFKGGVKNYGFDFFACSPTSPFYEKLSNLA